MNGSGSNRRGFALRTLVLAAALALVPVATSSAAPVTDNLTGHVDAAGTVSQTFTLNVSDLSVPIQASLDLDDAQSANLQMFLTASRQLHRRRPDQRQRTAQDDQLSPRP